MSETDKKPGNSIDPDTGHEYDGIREFDNHLPNWWLITLFATVVFGYAYWFYYERLDGPGSRDEYRAELDQAAAIQAARPRPPVTDESLLALSSTPDRMATGAATFKQMCVACHGENGQGIVGPNLTDKFWIHGAKPLQILGTVTNGVTQKGMPAWGPVLGAEKVETVVAYVLTLRNKNVPGKEPQGDAVE